MNRNRLGFVYTKTGKPPKTLSEVCRTDNATEPIDVTDENALRTAVVLLVEAGRSSSSQCLSVLQQNNDSPALSGIYYTKMGTVYAHPV